MNILVIGGNGYIGSKIVRTLIKEGHSIVCTKRPNSNLSRLDDIIDGIKWIPASVDSIDAAAQYMAFDYMLNMACNYGRSSDMYSDVLEANIEFPLKALNRLSELGTKNFLTIGTGLPDKLNMYSFSKRIFSDFGRFYAEKRGVNFNNLLLEMFYGADEPKNRFLPSIISKMIKGEIVEATLGTQHRDIIDAEDIIKAILLVFHSDLLGYHEIPVGTGVAPAISEVIDYIWNETGRKSELRKGAVPMRTDEPDCVADTSVLKSIGVWEPVPWREGIKNMIDKIELEDNA